MGPYDNAGGVHLPDPAWEGGQWLSHEDGRLYIVPAGGDGVEGPDDELSDRVLQTLGGNDALTEEQAAGLGLSIVPNVLKRWDADIGYYSA